MTSLPKALNHFVQNRYTVALCASEEQRLLPSYTTTGKGSSRQGRKKRPVFLHKQKHDPSAFHSSTRVAPMTLVSFHYFQDKKMRSCVGI